MSTNKPVSSARYDKPILATTDACGLGTRRSTRMT